MAPHRQRAIAMHTCSTSIPFGLQERSVLKEVSMVAAIHEHHWSVLSLHAATAGYV